MSDAFNKKNNKKVVQTKHIEIKIDEIEISIKTEKRQDEDE
jgi:hypothetical protein